MKFCFLGSFISLNPSLNFIIYVAPKKQTPLKIRDADGKIFVQQYYINLFIIFTQDELHSDFIWAELKRYHRFEFSPPPVNRAVYVSWVDVETSKNAMKYFISRI